MSFSGLKSPESLSGDPRDDRSVSFGRYQMFPGLRLLLRDGHKVELGPRAFDVLWMLFEAAANWSANTKSSIRFGPAWRSRKTTSRPRCLRSERLWGAIEI